MDRASVRRRARASDDPPSLNGSVADLTDGRICRKLGGVVDDRVPVGRIRPLVLWLRERHGSIRAVSILSGIPESTLRGYVYNTKRKNVPPQAAEKIAALVLAHRKPRRPLDIWEEQPGLRGSHGPPET